jgi:hypothetical protein
MLISPYHTVYGPFKIVLFNILLHFKNASVSPKSDHRAHDSRRVRFPPKKRKEPVQIRGEVFGLWSVVFRFWFLILVGGQVGVGM